MCTNTKQRTRSTDCEGPSQFTDWSQLNNEDDVSLSEYVKDCGNPFDEPDSNNATKLYEIGDLTKSYNKEINYKKLDKINSGLITWEWTNSPYNTYMVNSHHISALSNQLDLTKVQQSQVYHRFMQLSLEKWGVSAELIAFCVCAVTVHNDNTERSYHYNQKEENKDDRFVQIAENLDLREKSIRKVYSKYRRYLVDKKSKNYDYLEHEKRQ